MKGFQTVTSDTWVGCWKKAVAYENEFRDMDGPLHGSDGEDDGAVEEDAVDE